MLDIFMYYTPPPNTTPYFNPFKLQISVISMYLQSEQKNSVDPDQLASQAECKTVDPDQMALSEAS